MTNESTPIDIRTIPELARLVDEVRTTGKPRRLCDATEDVALLVPAPPKRRRAVRTVDHTAFLGAAGSWEGLLDPEQLKRDLRAARGDDCDPVAL